MITNKTKLIVAWHNIDQIKNFCEAWKIDFKNLPKFIILEQDKEKKGCALTKNAGIEKAIISGAENLVVLDDDCFPSENEIYNSLEGFIHSHILLLDNLCECEMYETVTFPQSRGTPYFNKSIKLPVAGTMGFWENIGDYDAPSQLVHGATKKMNFVQKGIINKYFAYSGMNCSFKAKWWPWFKFINCNRFDDIFMGYLFQKKAFSEGYCFNLNGPIVKHSRQSNIWVNLRDEALNLERNETIWSDIYNMKLEDYEVMIEKLKL